MVGARSVPNLRFGGRSGYDRTSGSVRLDPTGWHRATVSKTSPYGPYLGGSVTFTFTHSVVQVPLEDGKPADLGPAPPVGSRSLDQLLGVWTRGTYLPMACFAFPITSASSLLKKNTFVGSMPQVRNQA